MTSEKERILRDDKGEETERKGVEEREEEGEDHLGFLGEVFRLRMV